MNTIIDRWGRLDRRRMPGGVPPLLRHSLAVLLLLVVAYSLVRDIGYLRSIPTRPVPIDDIFAYNCYSQAFWHGPHAMVEAPLTRHCADHAWQFWVAPPRAFHTMPREYPAPALAVFSLPLLVPGAPYDVTYMVMMAVLVFGVTAWMMARRLLLCATAFALYVLVGGWSTVLARYDLVPGVLVLGALVLAERRRWAPAYLVAAAATLLKIYPAFVVPVLALHQWRATGTPPWRGLALFGLAVVGGLLPGALLNPAGFVGPLGYNGVRPPQIESVAGSLLWLSGRIGGTVHVRLTYHSVNVTGALAGLAAWLATLLLIGGLILVCWRAWQGRDSLGRSFVLVMLVTLCGSKLLSPQYMLWLFPVAAYVEGLRLRWILVAALTLGIYPYAYTLDNSLVHLPDHFLFMGLILARNAVLVVLMLAYLQPVRCVRELYGAWQRTARTPDIGHAGVYPHPASAVGADRAYERAD